MKKIKTTTTTTIQELKAEMFDFLLFLQAVWTLVCCAKGILRLRKHGTRSFYKC